MEPVQSSFRAGAGRLDIVVAAQLGKPRADAQRAIAEGLVLVDGRPRPKSHRLAGGELVTVETSPARAPAPPGPPVEVRYQDEHLLVVSKPAGLITHPSPGRRTGTLVHRLLASGVALSSAGGPDRPGIVHRLDAGTSGLMVVAKDNRTHVALAELFRRHGVDRTYLALVRGRPAHQEFLVEAPLERSRARIVVRAGASREAATAFTVRERLPRSTLLEARPRTGRTHQIRVHISSAGHPILGDRSYGGGGDEAARLGLTRPFLHSWRIGFDHPISGGRVELEEPLPPELERALRRARSG